MAIGSEVVATRLVDGYRVDIVGCWDSEGSKGETGFEFYDLFIGDVCLNMGEPLNRRPQNKTIRLYIEGWKETLK